MAIDEILAAVQASAEMTADAQAGNLRAVARSLSVGLKRVVVGNRLNITTASARYQSADGLPGPLAFEAAMMALEDFATAQANSETLLTKLSARATARALEAFREDRGLDFGAPALREMLALLTPSVLTQGQCDAFLALAEVPDPVTETQVRAALTDETGLLRVGGET